MKKLIALTTVGLLLCAAPAYAQMMLMGVGRPQTIPPASYTGPGDIKTFNAWYGTYAYNSAARGTNAVQVCDQSNANCTDLVSDATTGIVANPTLGGTACNTSTNICTIKIWYDQTGGGFNVTQATAGSRHTWVPAGSCTGLGASISCGNGTAQQYTTTGNYVASQPISAMWVSKANTSTGTTRDTLYSDGTGLEAGDGWFGNDNTVYCYAGGGNHVSSTDGSWSAVSCSFNGASSNIRVDSTNTAGDTSTNGMSGTMRVMWGVSARSWQGMVASVGVANSNFSTTDLSNINANSHTILGF